MEPMGRLFSCDACRESTFICRHCDRGHRYCPDHAYERRRDEIQEESRHRYNRSDGGKQKAKDRKRRERARKAAIASGNPIPPWAQITPGLPDDLFQRRTNVTDPSSQSANRSATMAAGAATGRPWTDESSSSPKTQVMFEAYRCAFCGRSCGTEVRLVGLATFRRSAPARPGGQGEQNGVRPPDSRRFLDGS